MHMKAECKDLKEIYGNNLFSGLFTAEHRSKRHSTHSEKLLLFFVFFFGNSAFFLCEITHNFKKEKKQLFLLQMKIINA